jgi:two-component system, cell cycle response regulator DivK
VSSRILLAEGVPDIQMMVCDTLKFAGHDVQAASDGQETLDVLKQGSFDLLILALRLPKVDGWTILRRLRGEPSMARLPILVLTACALPGDETRAREAGCDAFVTKPFTVPQLLHEVELLLQRR